jgi:long-chain acyl-CoA synthetase
MEITRKHSSDFFRVFDILTYQWEKYPNATALNAYEDGKWRGYSIQEIQQQVDALSCWFIRNGYLKGDKIMLAPVMGKPAWMILDFACQQCGLITVPVHPTSQQKDIELIARETEAKLFISADEELYKACSSFIDSAIVNIHHLDPNTPGYFEPIQATKASAEEMANLAAVKRSISEDDLISIMYTSGSSGYPKGVMLTHRNMVHNIKSVLTMFPLEPHHRVLSFLPFSHILERMACYSYMSFGVSLYFSQNKESFAHDFKMVKPFFCTSVPRVLEKMYDFMEEQLLQKNLMKRKVIAWAMDVGKQYGGRMSVWYRIKLFFASVLVLRQWRKKLGGRIRYMVVGAAALRPEIGRLFSASGIHVAEGYGMTETAPLISINRYEPGLNQFGTVGLPIPGVDVKINEPNEEHEGEILVKGPNVMSGYFKKPELTKEVFTEDGWFRTGDVGKFVHKRFLKITDRKKDIFKTSSGKYIAPLPLQNHFTKSPFIQRCLILGFQQPYVTALIVPHVEMLEAWCTQEHIHWTAPQFMVHNIKVRAMFQREVDRLNESLPNVERIRNFILCHQDWSVEQGELTTTLKPVRAKLLSNYESEIEKMYSM